jgi:hypothetical protein
MCTSLQGRHTLHKRMVNVNRQQSLSSLMPIVCARTVRTYARIPRNSAPGLTFRALASFTIVTRDRFRLPLSIAPTNVTCKPANSANRSWDSFFLRRSCRTRLPKVDIMTAIKVVIDSRMRRTRWKDGFQALASYSKRGYPLSANLS